MAWPLSVTIPRVSSSAVSSRNTVHSANSSISAASHSIVVEVLTRRIQDLEASLQSHEGEPCPGVSLEAELEHSREVHLQAQCTNHSLTSKVAELETRLKQTQEELSEALRQTVSPQSDELEALRAENKRLTNLLRVIVPPNATCSVLDCAAARVKAGEDSEEALVGAIKDALGQPGSHWRTLLEPIVGERSPEDYIAQVNCTLRARRETRDWRKRAKFWKISARNEGRHQDTVTPSASALSDVVEQILQKRKNHVEELPKKLEESSTCSDATYGYEIPQDGSEQGPIPSTTLPDVLLSPSKEITPEIQEQSSVVITPPRSGESVRHDTVASSYATLPPLASVTFRESYSIRSLTSKRDVLELPPSASTSTQGSNASRKSRRRKVRLLAISVPSGSGSGSGSGSVTVSNSSSGAPITSSTGSNIVSGSVSALLSPEDLVKVDCGSEPESPPTRSGSSSSLSSWARLSGFITRSFSSLGASPVDVVTSSIKPAESTESRANGPIPSNVQQTALEHGLNSSGSSTEGSQSGSSLVIVHMTPERRHRTQSPSPISSTNTSPSPTKKSRLPVPVSTRKVNLGMPTSKLMKRFSISKPIFADSTNASVFFDNPSAKKSFGRSLPATQTSRAYASKKAGKGGLEGGKRFVFPRKKVLMDDENSVQTTREAPVKSLK
ncbi:hypothetical protein PHLCEN_2v11995 [Hermanssonia centrifuga]|uniref:Uncharacterized protein n=1 Tax=Hermanssonia centrifuga TaxID=98765 RepID=A0A2R6NIC3_9APHY|nr:hypothetical protein PHLCEN_2v11995 [Hermanssonia centrifuga]